jgi:two-component system, OmpR family, KDP operon response regulator KdpE
MFTRDLLAPVAQVKGARLLVIDDERAILRAVGTGLRARGYEVITAVTGDEGLSRAALEAPDVIVLDLGLPDLDGVEVCRRIRQWTETPIVILSAHGAEARKVEALDEGADDFITKPFGMAELEARLRVALRHRARGLVLDEAPSIDLGPLHIDLASRATAVHGQPVVLTAREFDLLAFLARHPGRVISHRMLLEEVWGAGYGTQTHYLRVYANHLRKKIEDDPAHPVLLLTSPGVGYQLVAPDDSDAAP